MEQGLILDADLGSRNRKRVVLDMSDLSMFCVFPLQQGTIGFEQHIDKCLDLSHYLYTKIKGREGYQIVFDGEVRFFLPSFSTWFFFQKQQYLLMDYPNKASEELHI